MDHRQQQTLINKAAAAFPAEFGLRAAPGHRFRISIANSYVSETYGLLLYTQRWDSERTEWLDYAKGTPDELRRELVFLPGR